MRGGVGGDNHRRTSKEENGKETTTQRSSLVITILSLTGLRFIFFSVLPCAPELPCVGRHENLCSLMLP